MLHYQAIFLYLLPTIVKRRMLRKSRISVIPNIRYTFNSLLLVKIKSRHRLQEGEDFCILVMSMVEKVRGQLERLNLLTQESGFRLEEEMRGRED